MLIALSEPAYDWVMVTIAPPAVDAWKDQPRAVDGTWGEKPLPAPPPIERPDYEVIRSRGRMTILGHKFVLKFDNRQNRYHYDKSRMAYHLLGPEYRAAAERADFLVDRLNDGTFDIHGLSAAASLLKAFNRDAQSDGSRLRLPASIPADINPAAVIARWMTAGERTPSQWGRAIDVLFGHGDKSDCLKTHVDTGDHSPWDWSDIDTDAVADCVDALTERIEAARSRGVEPVADDFDTWAESVAKLPPYRFLRIAVRELVLGEESFVSPELASRWLSGVIGPSPYHPAMLWVSSVRDTLQALVRKALDSPENLIEFLEHVRDGDECYGTAVATAVLFETADSIDCTPESLEVAWDIVLQGDSPDVMRKALALHGTHVSEMSPDAATFLPRERSAELNEHLRDISLQHIVKDYLEHFAARPERHLPPNVTERLERADEALRRYKRELAVLMPGGLASVVDIS